VDQEDAVSAVTALPLPEHGLNVVCSMWSGRGQLWQAVAATTDPNVERRWTREQVERRALRVLFTLTAEKLGRLPGTQRDWFDALPGLTRRIHSMSPSPVGRVDWVKSALGGWPPRAFAVRRRERQPDIVLVTALAWAAQQASKVLAAVPAPASATESTALERLSLLAQLREHPTVLAATPQRPTGEDLKALYASGSPWRQLGRLVKEWSLIESPSLTDIARQLLAPDPEIRWRLFHLAVLGEVLAALDGLGATIVSTGPLADQESNAEASFVAVVDDHEWRLWFEAAGIWKALSKTQPYKIAAEVVRGQSRALGADLLLIDAAAQRALVIECKFSANPSVVGRDGFHQASTYLAEGQGRLTPNVVSVVVGPATVVSDLKLTDLVGGKIGFAPPECIADLVVSAVNGSGPFTSG
jgi:hypothetical protein